MRLVLDSTILSKRPIAGRTKDTVATKNRSKSSSHAIGKAMQNQLKNHKAVNYRREIHRKRVV